VALACGLFALSSRTAPGTEREGGGSPAVDHDLAQLAEMMTGSFSSEEQAAADSAYFDIRLHMARIWPERDDGFWLYVEQAAAGSADRPYRQRIYHLRRTSADTLASAVFVLPGPEAFVGAWQDPGKFAGLTPDSLSEREGCAVFLTRLDDSTFGGGTRGGECSSSLRGASYATSEVEVRSDGLLTWDRGFDAAGNQVWGATRGGYVFRKRPASQ
jgi:hypothetical protein